MDKKNKISTIKSTIVDYSKSIGVAIVASLVIKSFVFAPTLVSGQSMMPTLNDKDRLFISKIQYNLNLKEFKRGDIVVLEAPDRDALYVKRIIGLPGDIVKIENGNVYINGNILKENYIEKHTYTDTPNESDNIIVKEGYYFVLGDNRSASKDSRVLGTIPVESLEGKAEFRFFPLDSLKLF